MRVGAIAPEGSLLAIAHRVARKWWLIILIMVISTAGAALWMSRTVPLYTASTIVSATASSGSKLGGALSSLSFGASQLGIDLGQPAVEPGFTEFLQVLTSVTLAERLEERHGVLRRVFQSRWDVATNAWLPPRGFIARLKGGLRTLFGQPAWLDPGPATLAGYLTTELSATDPLGTGMYLISISHTDRTFAGELLGWILREADDIIKERTIARSREQIAYFNEKIAETALREQRMTLVAMLLVEERDVVLASSELPFAAKFVDEIVVSDLPTFPDPFSILAMVILGSIAATVLGILVVDVVRYA